MAFRLIPREERFYDDFVAMAEQIRRGAMLLSEMLAPERPIWDKADEIKEVEHQCDTLTHQIIQRLNRTFVTPLDREDIFGLARSLDDVMDAIDATRRHCAAVPDRAAYAPTLVLLAAIISASVDQRGQGAEGAREEASASAEPAVEINRLENEADRAHQAAVRSLFEEERDPVAIIKWKEILDLLEEATDRCEDVANVFEGVVVKHG